MRDDYEETPPPDSELQLVKTRLRVQDGELQRLNSDGGFTLRLPLSAIESVDYRQRWDPFIFVFILAAIGLALLAYLVAEYNWLIVLLYLLAGTSALIGLSCAFGKEIHIRARGALTRIPCLDENDEGDGFVCSLRQMLGGSESSTQFRA